MGLVRSGTEIEIWVQLPVFLQLGIAVLISYGSRIGNLMAVYNLWTGLVDRRSFFC